MFVPYFLLECHKKVVNRLKHYNLLFQHLEHNTLKKNFYLPHLELPKQIIY